MSEIDRYFPKQGPCLFCGDGDGRHRIIDAIVGRAVSGESYAEIALDMDLSVDAVEAAMNATDEEVEG